MTIQEIQRIHLEKLAKPGIKYYTGDKVYIGNIEGRLELVADSALITLSGAQGIWNTVTVNSKGLVVSGTNTPYITLTSLSATSPIFYDNITGIISSQAATGSLSGYVSTSSQIFGGAKTFSATPTFSTMTSGSVLFAGTSGILSQNNSNLFWNNSTTRLGIGTSSPSARTHIIGTGTTSATIALQIDDSSFTTASKWQWKDDGILYLDNKASISGSVGLSLVVGAGWTYVNMGGTVTAIYANEVRTQIVSSGFSPGETYMNCSNSFQFHSKGESGATAKTAYIFDTDTAYINAGSNLVEFQNNTILKTVIDKSGNIGIGVSVPTKALHVVGSIRMVDGNQGVGKVITDDGTGTGIGVWATPTTILSGTYTPTLFNTTNITASTAYSAQYMQVGNTVTVSGKVQVDPTLGLATELGISIPITSNLTAEEHLGGTAFAPAIAGMGAAIMADAANDRASMKWVATDLTNQTMMFHFTYRIT